MPDEQRIHMARDLTPEGYRIAEPLIARMIELETKWVHDGDEAAYEEWRTTVTALQRIVDEHYTGSG